VQSRSGATTVAIQTIFEIDLVFIVQVSPPSKRIPERKGDQICMKVAWNKNVLRRLGSLIFVIAVITPIGLSGPSFCKRIFEACDRLSPK
jgi:hypothetical protein